MENHSGANCASVDEAQQDQESTAYAEAKSILHRVKESSNAYPPLKSVAKDLWLILNNSKVWTLLKRSIHNAYGSSRKQG